MKLEAITVCVNYGDILLETAEKNAHQFDKWIIVTTLDDQETHDVVLKYPNVQIIATESFYKDGAKFAKHNGYNEALEFVDKDSFVLFLDADIVLQDEFREVFEKLELEKGILYGIDRVNCTSYKKWKKYKEGKTFPLVVESWLLGTGPFKLMPRLAHRDVPVEAKEPFEGYKPLGYFQLSHRSNFDKYPDGGANDAASSDVAFSRLFKRKNTRLIPELICIHLDSIESKLGANWSGRTTPKFK